MAERKVYTMGEAARELGVSKTTVSRALSGKGRISEATRARVMEFVAAHGGLGEMPADTPLNRNERTGNIGLVLPTLVYDQQPAFFRDLVGGICEAAADGGHDVILSVTDGKQQEQLRRLAEKRKIDGAIVSRATANSRVESYLLEQRIPLVVIGPAHSPYVPCLDNDNRSACRELTGILLMKGMRRLALMGGNSAHLVTGSRLDGYLDAHREHGLQPEHTLLFMGIDRFDAAMEAVSQAMDAGADGLLCMDDIITGLVLGCLRERKVRVPEDIRVASFYGGPLLAANRPPITSLSFDTRELGRNACRMLLGLIGSSEMKEIRPSGYQVILRESTQ